jgi:hypothetical protein
VRRVSLHLPMQMHLLLFSGRVLQDGLLLLSLFTHLLVGADLVESAGSTDEAKSAGALG